MIYLCNTPWDEESGILGIGQHALSSIEATEIGSTIDNNSLDRNIESTVQSNEAIRLDGLLQAINETVVLTFTSSSADISSQTCTSEIQGVDKAQWCCTSSTTGSQVTQEITPELRLLIDSTQENLFVDILESKVQGLCGEITDDIGQVTSPESHETLFLGNTDEAIDDTCKIVM